VRIDEFIINRAKGLRNRIILPETDDERTLEAASMVLKWGIALPVLLGDEVYIKSVAAEKGYDLSGAEFFDPAKKPELYEEFAEEYYNLRKHKGLSLEEAREEIKDPVFYSAMMVRKGMVDGMVTGAAHATAHVLRAVLRIIGLKESARVLSSYFVMWHESWVGRFGESGIIVVADPAVIPNPTSEQLADIAISTADSARALLGVEPKVAMLSYSTFGSGSGEDVEKVRKAVELAKERRPDLLIEGEMQADAALVESVGKKKAPNSKVAGKANVLIFPDLNAGNIAYKMVERLAGANAIGVPLTGCAKPVSDLSRGVKPIDLALVIGIISLMAEFEKKNGN
jgi:phosphate acetyltransferase